MTPGIPGRPQASGGEFIPLFAPLTIPAMLARCWTRPPDNVALTFVGEAPLTFGAVRAAIPRLAAFLQAQGLGRGDKIALLSENQPHWGLAFFAITAMGAVAVPIMHEFPAADVQRILRDSGARAVFVSARLQAAVPADALPPPGLVIRLDDWAILRGHPDSAALVSGPTPDWSAMAWPAVNETDPASLLFTSGTAGLSKGVVLTHRNLIANAQSVDRMTGGLSPADGMLSILPLAHATEFTLGLLVPFMQGAAVHYLKKPPAAATLLPALAAVRPTIVLAVPLVIEKIYRNRIQPRLQGSWLLRALCRIPGARQLLFRMLGRKLEQAFGGRLRMFCIGGAALAEDVERFLAAAGFPYTVGYGLTETAPLVTGTPPERFVPGSCGQPIPGVEVRIADPDPETGAGEIQVRGPNVMAGYYTPPGAPAMTQPFTQDGWFMTGDMGVLDAAGFLFVRGRRKNIIVHPSGKKTHPEAIEQMLNEHPVIGESLVHADEGGLLASVFLDPDKLEQDGCPPPAAGVEHESAIARLLHRIMTDVNHRLPPWSRLRRIVRRMHPFDKTPSKKIKRGP